MISSKQSVAMGTIYLSFVLIISKLLGFLREVLIADLFGTSQRLDAVLIALTPATILSSIVSGAILTVFIPYYIKLKQNNSKISREYATGILLFTSLILFAFGFLLLLFPKYIIRIFAPGFSENVLNYAARKLKYLAFYPIITALNNLIGGILRSERNFFQYSISQLSFNIVAIPIIFYFAPFLSEASYILALIVGNSLIGIIQFLFAKKYLSFSFKINTDVLKTISLATPLFLSGSLGSINRIVDRIFVSFLPPGRIAALNYANILLGMVNSIFISSFLTTSHTELSELVAKGNKELIQDRMRKSANVVINISIPVIIWMTFMGEELIRFIYEHGKFTSESTQLVFLGLLGYSGSIIFASIRTIGWQFLMAIRKVQISLLISPISIGANAFFDWIFLKPFGHGGIAASTSVVSFITLSIIVYLVKKEGISFIPWKRTGILLLFSIVIILFSFLMKSIFSHLIYLLTGNLLFLILTIWANWDVLSFLMRKFKSFKSKT